MRTWLHPAVFALTGLAVWFGSHATAVAQPTQTTVRVESSLALTVEIFCSETKLRTTDARIRWGIPRTMLDASSAAGFAAANPRLEVTVYKNGFDKGLLVALPLSAASSNPPAVPQAANAQTRPQLRAFQIRVIEVEQPRTAQALEAGSQMGVVVENLEPGINYTFRIAMDTPAGRIASPPATKQAQVCPADFVLPRPVPGRKR